jgi:hypothetical protein
MYSTLDVVKYLIEKDVKLHRKYGSDLILNAIKHSTSDIVKYLIDKQIPMSEKDIFDKLCKKKMYDIFVYLIDRQENVTIGNTSLIHYIVLRCPPAIIKYAIDKKFFLECQDNKKCQPIHHLIRYRSDQTELLIQMFDSGIDLECENQEKKQPIHYCIEYATTPIIFYLINLGVNLRCHDGKLEPVHYAIRKSNISVSLHIINQIVIADPEFKDKDIVHYVIKHFRGEGKIEMLDYLINQGFNMESLDADGLKPIHLALKYCNMDLLKYLLNRGVRLESDGIIDLIFENGVNYGRCSMIKYLIETKHINISGWVKGHCKGCGKNHPIYPGRPYDLCVIWRRDNCTIL